MLPSKSTRSSWLGTSSFLAHSLSPELCQVLMRDRVLAGTWRMRRKHFGHKVHPDYCSTEKGKGPILPLCPFDLCSPSCIQDKQFIDALHFSWLPRIAMKGQGDWPGTRKSRGEQGNSNGENRFLERRKEAKENLLS